MFKQVSPFELEDNLFQRIGKDWMLVTAGTAEKNNSMTASWGQAGFLWNRPVVTIYIRPQRYTLEFIEQQQHFSLSFFEPDTQRDVLNLMGTKSGREVDKLAETSLRIEMIDQVPVIQQAELIIVCRKLYQQDMLPGCFLDNQLDSTFYPDKDYHRMSIAEIQKVCQK